jgi:hypothetical protein
MRTVAAALVIALGAPAVGLAQQAAFPSPVAVTRADSSCTYDRCALRLESGWWNRKIVRGGPGEQVARLGLFGDRVLAVVRGDSATYYARSYEGSSARGAAAFTIGSVLLLTPLSRHTPPDHSPREVTVMVSGFILQLVGAHYFHRAERSLSRALWWHNRELATPPR